MRKNTFIKSMSRQPLRTALLILLIAAAVFAFVLHATEYIVISDQITNLGKYYRSIGYLSGSNTYLEDVAAGADIVSKSAYVEFEDRRRASEGILQGMPNADISGWNGIATADGLGGLSGFTEHLTDAFFYGELLSIKRVTTVYPNPPYDILTFKVDDIMSSYPEYLAVGNEISVHYYLSMQETEALEAEQGRLESYDDEPAITTAVSGMAVGNRYFIRGMEMYDSIRYTKDAIGAGFPKQGKSNMDYLVMRPVNSISTNWDRKSPDDRLWYIPVARGEQLDVSVPEIEWLADELARVNLDQHSLQLRTTVDMTAIPYAQPQFGTLRLVDGRWLDRDDYANQRNVAVIHDQFARLRGLEIGDTITVSIPETQYVINLIADMESKTHDYLLKSTPDAGRIGELELEIVGFFNFPSTSYADGITQTSNTLLNTLVYIPDSILPTGIEYLEHDTIAPVMEMAGYGQYAGVDTLPGEWYSFVLSDPKDEKAFLMENNGTLIGQGDTVGSTGLRVYLLDTGFANYWASAEPMLQGAAFNAVLFAVVLILVFALVLFVHIRQRRKEYAIMRALGRPMRKSRRELLNSTLICGLPAVLVGGLAAWYFALGRVAESLNPFGEIATAFNFQLETSIPAVLLLVLIASALALFAIITMVGATVMARSSVFALLQGQQAAMPSIRGMEHESQTEQPASYAKQPSTPPLPSQECASSMVQANAGMNIAPANAGKPSPTIYNAEPLSAAIKPKGRNFAIRFIFRHITRSKAKTALAIIAAVFFVFALGYINGYRNDMENEILRLYDTISVSGTIRAKDSNDTATMRSIGNVIGPTAVENVLNSGFVQMDYLEAGHEYALLTLSEDEGAVPEKLKGLSAFNYEVQEFFYTTAFEQLLGFSDIDMFASRNSRNNADSLPGAVRRFGDDGAPIEEFAVEYAEGYDAASFKYSTDSPIPVILSERVMQNRGISLGDTIYFTIPSIDTIRYRIDSWTTTPAIVIGAHNRNIIGKSSRDATLMPLSALENILGGNIGYTAFNYTVLPGRSREIDSFRAQLLEITMPVKWASLGFDLWDEELRTVVGSFEKNLSLMQMLYPVVISISVLIGFGLSFLLMLQNAKIAAVMRVLGTTRKKTGSMLCTEQLLVCVIGLALGICALLALSWVISLFGSTMLAGCYLISVFIGSAAGAVRITNRPPLHLLQVRE